MINWSLLQLKALIESDTNRKKTARMLYDFWQNNVEDIVPYLEDYGTKGAMFTTATMKVLPKTHRDITNKVLNNICVAYVGGVDRYLVDKEGIVNEEQTKLLNDIYLRAGIQDAQKEWYRAGRLFNTVETKVVWRKATEQVEFDVWTPNFFSVWENPESVHIKDAVLFDVVMKDKDNNDVEAIEFWSKDEHFFMVQTGTFNDDGVEKPKMVRMDFDGNNPDGKNPYSPIIPSVTLRFKRGEDYYGIGMVDLIEENIWADLRRSNFVFVEVCQGLGILYGVNLGKGDTIPITPNTMLVVNDVKPDMETPFIESVATNAPLQEIRESIEKNDTDILTNKGLSGQTGSADNRNAPALSKALDLEELEMLRREDVITLEDYERRLYPVVREVQNKNSVQIDPKNELIFKCKILDRKPTYNVNDSITKWRFEIKELGVKSGIDYLLAENPNLTIQQAEEQIKKANEQKDEEPPIGDNEPTEE